MEEEQQKKTEHTNDTCTGISDSYSITPNDTVQDDDDSKMRKSPSSAVIAPSDTTPTTATTTVIGNPSPFRSTSLPSSSSNIIWTEDKDALLLFAIDIEKQTRRHTKEQKSTALRNDEELQRGQSVTTIANNVSNMNKSNDDNEEEEEDWDYIASMVSSSSTLNTTTTANAAAAVVEQKVSAVQCLKRYMILVQKQQQQQIQQRIDKLSNNNNAASDVLLPTNSSKRIKYDDTSQSKRMKQKSNQVDTLSVVVKVEDESSNKRYINNTETSMHPSTTIDWTEEDLKLLFKLVEQYQDNTAPRWNDIANNFPGRSAFDCLEKWQNVSFGKYSHGNASSSVKGKGSWTPEEDQMIIEKRALYGRKWAKIASFLPGRHGKQCRERYVNHLNPELKKGDWTDDEEALLIVLRQTHGNQWAMISKELPGRSHNDVKNHWYATIKRKFAHHGEQKLIDAAHEQVKLLQQTGNLPSSRHSRSIQQQGWTNPQQHATPIPTPQQQHSPSSPLPAPAMYPYQPHYFGQHPVPSIPTIAAATSNVHSTPETPRVTNPPPGQPSSIPYTNAAIPPTPYNAYGHAPPPPSHHPNYQPMYPPPQTSVINHQFGTSPHSQPYYHHQQQYHHHQHHQPIPAPPPLSSPYLPNQQRHHHQASSSGSLREEEQVQNDHRAVTHDSNNNNIETSTAAPTAAV